MPVWIRPNLARKHGTGPRCCCGCLWLCGAPRKRRRRWGSGNLGQTRVAHTSAAEAADVGIVILSFAILRTRTSSVMRTVRDRRIDRSAATLGDCSRMLKHARSRPPLLIDDLLTRGAASPHSTARCCSLRATTSGSHGTSTSGCGRAKSLSTSPWPTRWSRCGAWCGTAKARRTTAKTSTLKSCSSRSSCGARASFPRHLGDRLAGAAPAGREPLGRGERYRQTPCAAAGVRGGGPRRGRRRARVLGRRRRRERFRRRRVFRLLLR